MFTVPAILCLTLAAQDPTADVQRRYPVRTIRITSASGTVNCYVLSADAPPELRKAYQVLESAEREANLADNVQQLKAEYLANERRLEAARTYRQLQSLYPAGGIPPRGAVQGRGFYSYPAGSAPLESSLKTTLSGTIAQAGTPEGAVRAAERLEQARLDLRKAWLDLAAREKGDKPR